MRLLQGPLAQLVEQLAFNQLVAGSNPARPTIQTKKASHRDAFFVCMPVVLDLVL